MPVPRLSLLPRPPRAATVASGRTRLRSVAAGVILGCLVTAACAQVPWPNLTEAETHLGLALDALHRAPDRFGGHKAEAARLIRAALEEIEAAKRAYR